MQQVFFLKVGGYDKIIRECQYEDDAKHDYPINLLPDHSPCESDCLGVVITRFFQQKDR